jgi:hypothetical protein
MEKFESDLMFGCELRDGIAQPQKGTDGDDVSTDGLQIGESSAHS